MYLFVDLRTGVPDVDLEVSVIIAAAPVKEWVEFALPRLLQLALSAVQ